MSEEIDVTLPPEPPPSSAVMTAKGQVYQRARGDWDNRFPDWWPALNQVEAVRSLALSWPILCSSGPLLLLTGETEFEWLAEKEKL